MSFGRQSLTLMKRPSHISIRPACLVLVHVLVLIGTAAIGRRCNAAEARPTRVERTRLTFIERHPLSSLDELCRRSGNRPVAYATPEGKKPEYDLADESF